MDSIFDVGNQCKSHKLLEIKDSRHHAPFGHKPSRKQMLPARNQMQYHWRDIEVKKRSKQHRFQPLADARGSV
jgi:hypothetical protein